ncbi:MULTISPECIES: inorganic phosphate transporter [Gordonia]|uniref:Phosphate transporter n=2 Tax=Gordonia TaxID=2053 RepID=L7LGG0_9ACTN|nr:MULTISPECIES: inorganic phosphate transporter [Gordonia]AUH69995.1 inorganic phosphate transporter [Gordonia sp. YC-JH1]KJR08392.1 inorganic phosphate transporter [Gordonia sihwensis]KXT58602.1 inorganic phosphate transporter [Gordonia sp. QH-12]MBY4569217.1 anion permease [Gordonia sihwensis]WFN93321.1 inorganic phosphate transporter [Gordonia sihwensis]
MTAEMLILVLLIVTALGFDFTNGFHDTGNAMATSIATGALKPKVAVGLSAILNLVGAFLSVEVAATITKDVLNIQQTSGDAKGELVAGLDANKALIIIFAGLIGAILWNLFTWLFGLPSSSSHALFGGLIGSGLAAIGTSGINWHGILAKVIVPALFAPVIACIVASVGTLIIYAISNGISESKRERGFRNGQIASASLVSLAHGTGDAQKTMGVIALALIATGHLDSGSVAHGLPFWVVLSCAGAIALGTWIGGWRIIRTLGKGLVEIQAPQGMAAEASSAAIILTSSAAGMALSTTQVATGSILGSGLGKKGAEVRWGVAGRMAVAWITTLPAAAAVGALCYWLASLIGGAPGAIVIFLILAGLSGYMYYRAQQQKVDADNVNADWDETTNSPVPAATEQS